MSIRRRLNRLGSDSTQYLKFRVNSNHYLISTQNIISLSEELLVYEPYNLSYDHIIGTSHTIYGNAIVLDLRVFFGEPSTSKPNVMLVQDNNQNNFQILVDEVEEHVELRESQIIRELYPLTNHEQSIFIGGYLQDTKFVYILSIQQILLDMTNGVIPNLGRNTKYHFKTQTSYRSPEPDLDQIYEAYIWIGLDIRFGIPISKMIEIHPLSNDTEIEFSDKSIDTKIYKDVPLLDLDHLYQIDSLVDSHNANVVIVECKGKVVSFLIPGDIIIAQPASLGNLQQSGLQSMIFKENSYIVDYTKFDDFVGYVLDIEDLGENELDLEIAPDREFEELEIESEDYIFIESEQNIAFSLDSIEQMKRRSQVESEVYDLITYLTSDQNTQVPFDQDRSKNQVCLQLRDKDLFFSTQGNIRIEKVYRDQIQEDEKLIVLENDKPYQLIIN